MILSMLLFRKTTLLNTDIYGVCLRIFGFFITTYHHSTATSKSLLGWQCSVHYIATPSLPLHWFFSVTLHICDALHIATPAPLSKYTPMPLRSVFGVLICIFAEHSYATPMPLQYHSIRAEWHFRLAYTPVYGNITLHRHYKDILLPLCQGNCSFHPRFFKCQESHLWYFNKSSGTPTLFTDIYTQSTI